MTKEFGIKIGKNKARMVAGFVLAFIAAFMALRYKEYTTDAGIAVSLVCILGFLIAGLTEIELGRKTAWLISLPIGFLAAAFTVCLSQLMCVNEFFPPELDFWLLGSLALLILYSFVYALCGELRLSVFIGSVFALLLSFANLLVFNFRGNELSLLDIGYIRTGLNVLSGYKIPINVFNYRAAALCLCMSFALFAVKSGPRRHPVLRRAVALLLCAVLTSGFCFLSRGIVPEHYMDLGSRVKGYILNFSLNLKELRIKPPALYSPAVVTAMEPDYAPEEDSGKRPNVIVIMNESFADLRVLGDLSTDMPVMPFIDSFTDNVIRGYALSSVSGGYTANCEWELFTGSSMAFLPTGSVPFQQYISRPAYSLVGELSGLGYGSYANHPASKNNWNRSRIYPLLGFEELFFFDKYDRPEYFRGFVTDSEVYNSLLERLNSQDKDEPLFAFGLTIQNHGGYAVDNQPVKEVRLIGYEKDYPDVEEYLSLIRRSDQDFADFIARLKEYPEPVVLLFFGDHLPNLDEDFLCELHGGDYDSLDEKQLRYKIPFVIWANYPIEAGEVELTSLNYLSTYLLEAAGLPLSPYRQYLRELEKSIPAINAFGYYSLSQGRFLPIEDAAGAEKEALDTYRYMQYNNVFDRKNRSGVFFPIAEENVSAGG